MATNAVQLKEEADSVRATLEKMKAQFALALPKHLTPDRLLRVAMTAVQNTPKLLECDRQSLFSALMACAQLGLEPDGVLGQAYLVPFAGKVQFIPGYKGLLTLARNTGEITSIQAHAVRLGDEFEYAYGLDERLYHKPGEDPDDGDEAITHFYAYAKYRDGGHSFEVMTRKQVEKIRDKSEGYKAFLKGWTKTSPWKDHFEQMGRKTAIRRLANYLPRQVQKAIEIENAYERGVGSSLNELGEVVFFEPPAEAAQEKAQITAETRMDGVVASGRRSRAKTDDKPKEEAKPAAQAEAGNVTSAASAASAGPGTAFAAEVERDAQTADETAPLDHDPETGEIIEPATTSGAADDADALQDAVDAFLDELGRVDSEDALERLLRSWQNQINDGQIAAFGDRVDADIEKKRELLRRRSARNAAQASTAQQTAKPATRQLFGDA